MKRICRKHNALVLGDILLNMTIAIARAITAKPELVKTRIHQVIDTSDYAVLVKTLTAISRPFAVAVITSIEDSH